MDCLIVVLIHVVYLCHAYYRQSISLWIRIALGLASIFWLGVMFSGGMSFELFPLFAIIVGGAPIAYAAIRRSISEKHQRAEELAREKAQNEYSDLLSQLNECRSHIKAIRDKINAEQDQGEEVERYSEMLSMLGTTGSDALNENKKAKLQDLQNQLDSLVIQEDVIQKKVVALQKELGIEG